MPAIFAKATHPPCFVEVPTTVIVPSSNGDGDSEVIKLQRAKLLHVGGDNLGLVEPNGCWWRNQSHYHTDYSSHAYIRVLRF